MSWSATAAKVACAAAAAFAIAFWLYPELIRAITPGFAGQWMATTLYGPVLHRAAAAGAMALPFAAVPLCTRFLPHMSARVATVVLVGVALAGTAGGVAWLRHRWEMTLGNSSELLGSMLDIGTTRLADAGFLGAGVVVSATLLIRAFGRGGAVAR